jgi:hypothetical protein
VLIFCEGIEPNHSLMRYDHGGSGVHDIHMNQGSQGAHFFNDGTDKDGNLIWQDGAVIIDFGTSWSAYFAVFTQQVVPTDNQSLSENRLGEGDRPILLRGLRKIGTVPRGSRIGSKENPLEGAHPFTAADEGGLAGG